MINQQVCEIKGFKNQEEYSEYLDNNNLEICSDCESEVKIIDSSSVQVQSGVINQVCENCLSEYGFCVDCDNYRPKEIIQGGGTGIDELCIFHFNNQYDGEMN